MALIWEVCSKPGSMVFNYLKIAFRNLSRNKIYSLINILGLSLGVACCLLLILYIQDEASYDKHQNRLDDLYRVVTTLETNGDILKMTTCSPPIAMAMRDEIPEVESAVRVLNPPGVARNLIRYEDKLFYETDGFMADSTLFEVLTYDVIKGNPNRALVEANSVVISEALSNKIFGDNIALDKIISISQGGDAINYKVTGVFREIGKSHIKANFFTSITSEGFAKELTTDPEYTNQWAGENFVPAYVKLAAGSDKKEVIKKMNAMLMRHGAKEIEEMGRKKTLSLEPVKDIYLRSDIRQSPRIVYTYVIASIAVFILLIACINFMNLSTAKATKRAAEIGIRKVMGAYRSSLVGQILGEAMVIVIISLLLSVIMVQISLPFFNDLTGKIISFNTENIEFFILALAVIAVVTGIVAGSYPAFYISSFQPSDVLKGKFKTSSSSGLLRRSLVVFQFMIAITLVCVMLIISDQLNYMQEKDLGFDSHAKIVLPLRTVAARKIYEPLKRELQNESSIKKVAGADYVPGSEVFGDGFYYPKGGNMETAVDIHRDNIDVGYLELMGIKLLGGRHFTENRKSESQNKYILNRTAAKKLGFTPEEIIGEMINNEWDGQKSSYEIIGVVEDFHQTGLKDEIEPLLFELAETAEDYSFITLDVDTENFQKTIDIIEKKWKSLAENTPFEFTFLDDSIQQQYNDDRKVSSIITSFTLIAMLISCLGLYGLSSYMAERRFKEIGVRKVMGASVKQVVSLMSGEFIKLVLIAFVISVPLSWYTMHQWLTGFAYKTPIDPMIFMTAGSTALFIALITVSFESIKAALTNPVNSLKNE